VSFNLFLNFPLPVGAPRYPELTRRERPSEAEGAKLVCVTVDSFGPAQKLGPVTVEKPVMIEIVNIYFESSASNILQE